MKRVRVQRPTSVASLVAAFFREEVANFNSDFVSSMVENIRFDDLVTAELKASGCKKLDSPDIDEFGQAMAAVAYRLGVEVGQRIRGGQ